MGRPPKTSTKASKASLTAMDNTLRLTTLHETLAVKDSSDLADFLKSARKVWREKHPLSPNRRKGGRSTHEHTIFKICDDVWEKYRKKPPSLGKFLRDVEANLKDNKLSSSRNTVRKHLIDWLETHLAAGAFPVEMIRRNPEVKQLVEMEQWLFKNKDVFRAALDEFIKRVPNPKASWAQNFPSKN